MDSIGEFTLQDDFKALQQSHPKFYRFLEIYYKEQGGQTQFEEKGFRIDGKYNLLRIEMEIVRHFLAHILTPLYNFTDFYLYVLSRANSDANKTPSTERLLVDVKDLIKRLNAFVPTVPQDVWNALLIAHKVDLSTDPEMEKIGENLSTISKELNDINESASDPEARASDICDKVEEFWVIYRKLTSNFPD